MDREQPRRHSHRQSREADAQRDRWQHDGGSEGECDASDTASGAPRESERCFGGDQGRHTQRVPPGSSLRTDHPSSTIFIKGIPGSADEEELRRLFIGWPGIQALRLSRDAYGMSRGFAFLEFDSIERAQALIDAPGACQLYLTDSTYPITLQYSHSVRRGGRGGEHHHGAPAAAMPVLAVSNLDLGVTAEILALMFGVHAKPTDIRIPFNNETGMPGGLAYVTFASCEEANDILSIFHGRTVPEVQHDALHLTFAEEHPSGHLPRNSHHDSHDAYRRPGPDWDGLQADDAEQSVAAACSTWEPVEIDEAALGMEVPEPLTDPGIDVSSRAGAASPADRQTDTPVSDTTATACAADSEAACRQQGHTAVSHGTDGGRGGAAAGDRNESPTRQQQQEEQAASKEDGELPQTAPIDDFVYDSTTGYQYSSSRSMYHDNDTGFYFSIASQAWLVWDANSGQYHPAAGSADPTSKEQLENSTAAGLPSDTACTAAVAIGQVEHTQQTAAPAVSAAVLEQNQQYRSGDPLQVQPVQVQPAGESSIAAAPIVRQRATIGSAPQISQRRKQEMEQLRKEQQALAAAKEKREQQAAAKKQKSAAAAKARRLQNAAAAATAAAAAHAMHSSVNSAAVGQGQTAVVQSAAVGIVQGVVHKGKWAPKSI